MIKDRYEISIWEDCLVPGPDPETTYFEEKKIAVIGSNTMTATCRAYGPRLVENINGSNTFTFKMYYTLKENNVQDIIYQYFTSEGRKLLDSDERELFGKDIAVDNRSYTNPFLSLLTNERKIKVLWKGKWYDLIIKNCQEDSSGKSITYTCKDLYVNELSKSGFELEFDTELENNQGTVAELAEKILEGSDWQLDMTLTDTIQEKKEEPVYEVEVSKGFSATNETRGETFTVEKDSKILVFYTPVLTEATYCQFLYDAENNYPRDTNSQLVVGVDCCSVNLGQWEKSGDGTQLNAKINGEVVFKVLIGAGVSPNFRGTRLIKGRKKVLDRLTGKYCDIYEATATNKAEGYEEGNIIYRYKSTEYRDPTMVNNLVVNPKNFANLEGWGAGVLVDYDVNESTALLKIPSGNTYNAGASASSNFIPNGFQKGEQYVGRIRARKDISGSPGDYIDSLGFPVFRIGRYKIEGGNKVFEGGFDTYFNVSGPKKVGNWVERTYTCKKSVTRADIYNEKVGFFLSADQSYWIEEVQFFPLVYGENEERINPGEMDKNSIAQTYYYYFNHTSNEGALNPEEVSYLYTGTDDWDNTDIVAQYNENFEKIRSISAKNSNRFNLLQSLAETFECWCKFTINHDENGKVKRDATGALEKYVSFVKEIGQETGVGFVYGIDLKTISRTIESEQIVTKTIVTPNNNEFATGGFCTIARSPENYARDTFILNFDYYVNQGMLSGGALNKDLYSSADLGYYYNLNRLNTEYDEVAEMVAKKREELLRQESYEKVYRGYIDSYTNQSNELRQKACDLAGVSDFGAAKTYAKANSNYVDLINCLKAESSAKSFATAYTNSLGSLEGSIENIKDLIENKETRLKEIQEELKILHHKFYKKYSRFIQEGSWIDEDYIDDTLYYLDAQSVAYTSSRPQIDYNISVLRISSQEGFESKVFRLGDISFIQDTEFFGYTYPNGVKTPYKEKVLVTEIVSNFDAPELDSFKVQNYKTQFEDLFQRITSVTQSLQYASGEYARAASIVEPDGTLKLETLQASFAVNESIVISKTNESVLQDSTGITVIDLSNPSERAKITSGGIFISTDGGESWKSAIRGSGISAESLTSGSINTSQITILNGGLQTFRWDSQGISAYEQRSENQGVNLSKFVRFDHYGIYGINNNSESLYAPESEAQIWEDALFGLTWEGLFIKNKYGDHLVEVSSRNDIQIVETPDTGDSVVRLKIGLLDEDKDIYGLRLADSAGEVVLETHENGKLWLRNALNISSSDESTYSIAIGYLDTVENGIEIGGIDLDAREIEGQIEGEGQVSGHYHRTLDINNSFVVWEDGTVYAEDGYFAGTINAKAGQVGVLKVLEDETVIIETKYIEVTETGDVIEGVFEAIRFDGEGITINSGGIKIKDKYDKPLLQFNDDGTGLIITGGGSFTGEVNATSGRFEGSVFADYLEASSGEIGGWILGEEGLYSRATRNEEDDPSLENSSVVLDGENGYIKAERIYLGVGAQIENYLQLGDAYLYNPEKNDGELLRAGATRLWEDGKMHLGEIEVDGENSIIKGTNFSIHPDYSEFSNVNVSGKISTCVFETNHVQSVGGSMIFKPSYKIVEYTNDKIVLDKKYEGRVGNYVYIVQKGGKLLDDLVQVARIEENKIFLSSPIDLVEGLASLVDIGRNKDLIIGINSNDGATGHLLPRGMTVSEFEVEGKQVKVRDSEQNVANVLLEGGKTRLLYAGRVKEGTTPKAFLGDLGGSGISYGGSFLEGFGLFSDNVYLTGSLTTQIRSEEDEDESYAGVNTLNGATANKFEHLNDNSKIVFWAGAKIDDVQNALFQVTEKGSVYAQQGIFEGAIITDSYIESADIYAARIHGFSEGTSSNLDFYNAKKGISFWGADYVGRSLDEGSLQKKIFTIGMEGLYTEEDKHFIKIDDTGVAFEGVSSTMLEYRTKNEGGVHLHLKENRLAAIRTEGAVGNLSFTPSKVSLGIGEKGESVVIEKGEIGIMENTKMHKDVMYSEMMKYKKTQNGYDLYVIYEEEVR